jgi:uncharacterized protein YcbK (DUF882 family)
VLCGVLETIRIFPLEIVCGYRTAAYNAKLAAASAARNGGVSGVAKDSQHIYGRAADIRPIPYTRSRLDELYATIQLFYQQGKLPELGGLAIYPKSGWIHVDIRPHAPNVLATWNGS